MSPHHTTSTCENDNCFSFSSFFAVIDETAHRNTSFWNRERLMTSWLTVLCCRQLIVMCVIIRRLISVYYCVPSTANFSELALNIKERRKTMDSNTDTFGTDWNWQISANFQVRGQSPRKSNTTVNLHRHSSESAWKWLLFGSEIEKKEGRKRKRR